MRLVEPKKSLKNRISRLNTILNSVEEAVIAIDKKGIIEFVNTSALKYVIADDTNIEGKKFEDAFDIYSEQDNYKIDLWLQFYAEDLINIKKESYAYIKTKSNEEPLIEYTLSPIMNDDGHANGLVFVFRDYTEKKKKQDIIEYISYRDALTGIYNRRYFDQQIIALDTIDNLPLTIVYADINGLKLANDLKGHEAGDELIKLAAHSIKQELRKTDIIARLGGDEFSILLPRTQSYDAEKLIKRIKSKLHEKKVDEITLSISFGYATKFRTEDNIHSVISDSDQNMYNNKKVESEEYKRKTITAIKNAFISKNFVLPENEQITKEIKESIINSEKNEEENK